MPLDRQFAGMIRQAFDLARKPGLGRHIDKQIIDRRHADRGKHRLPVSVGKG